MKKSAIDTADFILFMDKLFDSVNGSSLSFDNYKPLRRTVTAEGPHVSFWQEAISVLESMKFYYTVSGQEKEHVPPTVANWILTLQGMIRIWGTLQKNGFKFLCQRNMNQDPLENFFGSIRSLGVRNVNPTCSVFRGSFKTLVLNNFLLPHSPGSNYEKDSTSGTLNSLSAFLEGGVVNVNYVQNLLVCLPPLEVDSNNLEFKEDNQQSLVSEVHSYISGYIIKKLLKLVHNCKTCKSDLVLVRSDECISNNLINYRKYSYKSRLTYPKNHFIHKLSKINDIIHFYLPRLSNQIHISKLLKERIVELVENKNFSCTDHDLFDIFVNYIIKFYINKWIKNVNLIINGSDKRRINDCVKKLALVYYKTKKMKKPSAIAKQKQLKL